MDQVMTASVNAGLLFISSIYGVNAVMFDRADEQFCLPGDYVSSRENEIVCQLLEKAKDKTAFFVKNTAQICYCLLVVEEKAMLVGPYRDEALRGSDVPEHLAEASAQRNEFLNYHRGLPMITLEQIKLMSRTMWIALYGSEVSSVEQEVSLAEYFDRNAMPEWDLMEEAQSQNVAQMNDMGFFFMEQVRSGNFEKALAAHRRMMSRHKKANRFILLNTIEGTSRLRTMISIALRQAHVPDTSAHILLEEYKLKMRVVTSTEETDRLNQKLIENACALVRNGWSSSYSQSIAQAIDHIHRNLAHPLTVTEIADAVGLTPNAFSSKFHEEVGTSATAYITTQRMKSAAQLLVYTNMSMSSICSHIGMMDANYFSNCFKKKYGMTPTAFRKRGIVLEEWFSHAPDLSAIPPEKKPKKR